MKIVIASKNKNKIFEIKNKFSEIKDIELLPLDFFNKVPDVVEDGKTFEENALKKAGEISEFLKMPVLADDSGLVVDALDGRPGIYSARYGGENSTDSEKNKLLLEELKNIPAEKRTARFICVIALVFPDGVSYSAKGECEGLISTSFQGDFGFGYDPVFYLPQHNKTMAELTIEEKNLISHRALALEQARHILESIIEGDMDV